MRILFLAGVPLLALACSSSSSTTPIGPTGGGGGGGAGGGGGGGGNGAGGGGGGGGGGAGGGGAANDDGGEDVGTAGCGTVSWAADIYPQITPTGHWQCAAGGCHNAQTSGSRPLIDVTSAETAYQTCLSAQLLNPSSTTPESTQLYALLSSQLMPLTNQGAQDATPAELTTLATWIGCNSPDN